MVRPVAITDAFVSGARGAPITIDTICLDQEARAYEAHMRSLRVLRALAGACIFLSLFLPVVVITATVVLAEEKDASLATMGAVTVAIGAAFLVLLLLFAHLFFFGLRTLAAGSERAARVMLVLIALATVVNAVSVASLINQIVTASVPLVSDDWSRRPVLVEILVADLASSFAWCLTMVGPIRLLRCRHSPLFPLFLNNNFQRRFWPSWAALLRDFWTLLGIPAPPEQKRASMRITLAAVVAIGLEASVLLWLLDLPGTMRNNVDKHQHSLSQQTMFLCFVAVLCIAPFAFWALFALSRKLRRYARRRAQLSMNEASRVDSRRPVLFLRSFGDDQVSLAGARIPRMLRFFDPGAVAGTLEELVVREFTYLGPVVAIGNPSDGLPPLGAARQYCRGEDWREVVGSLMDNASLIIAGVARSEGLAWEIAELRRKGHLLKTIFFLPPASAMDHAVLGHLLRLLGVSDGTLARVGLELAHGQAAIALSFPSADHGLMLMSTRVAEAEYELALRVPRLAGHELVTRRSLGQAGRATPLEAMAPDD